MSKLIEEETIDLTPIEFEDSDTVSVDDVDPRWMQIAQLTLFCEVALRKYHEQEAPPVEPNVEFARCLMDGLEAGQEVITDDRADEFRYDVTTIDDEQLAELQDTLGYVSQYFGVDLHLPIDEPS